MTGIEAASAIRVLLTAAGLSAVLASSAVAFNAIRWAGAGYLAYLGVRALRSRRAGNSPGPPDQPVSLAHSAAKACSLAWATRNGDLLPGVLPQFIHPGHGSQAAQPRLEGLAYLGLAGWAAITGSRAKQWETALSSGPASAERPFRHLTPGQADDSVSANEAVPFARSGGHSV